MTNERINRWKKIKKLLGHKSGLSASEIREYLQEKYFIKRSNKTVDRDLLSLCKLGIVFIQRGHPSRFFLQEKSLKVVLTNEELKEILRFLNPKSALYKKLIKTIREN